MRTQKKIDKRERIFQEAAELFARDGYYKVSVREICEAAGVTKPVLYYYFQDKENLLLAMMKETRTIVENLIEEYIKPDMTFEMQLEGVIKFYVHFLTNYPHLMKFSTFVQFMAVPEKVKEYKYKAAKKDWEKLESLFSAAQKDGTLKKDFDPKLLTQNFIGSIIVILSEYLMNHINQKKYKENLNSFLSFWKSSFLIDKN